MPTQGKVQPNLAHLCKRPGCAGQDSCPELWYAFRLMGGVITICYYASSRKTLHHMLECPQRTSGSSWWSSRITEWAAAQGVAQVPIALRCAGDDALEGVVVDYSSKWIRLAVPLDVAGHLQGQPWRLDLYANTTAHERFEESASRALSRSPHV